MELLGTFRYSYLLGAAFSLFFGILLFSKKNKVLADNILGAWLFILFAQLFIPFLYLANLEVYYRYAGYEIIFYAFHPFLLHLYVKATIGKIPGWKIMGWNSLIIIISELFSFSFMMYTPEERLLFIEGKKLLPLSYVPLCVILVGYFSYNIWAAYKALKDYKNNVLQVYSYRENIDLLWLRRLVMFFAGISILALPMGLISYFGFHSVVFADYFYFVTLAIFIFFLGYWGYQQGQVFNFNNEIIGSNEMINMVEDSLNTNIQTNQKKYKKESTQLKEVMNSQKPYLEPSITIHDLARMADMPSHVLSKVINKEFHSNFFEFINHYRIEEFKKRAFSNDYKNVTILGIAFDCGFNSKSAFNRIFKDLTGITPGDFIKNHKP